ncbi:MAG: hypothetical protein OEM03_03615 [Chromatiales bacterium]|nr:hypothetical protein [Chromatiales bacterium]
MSPLEKTWRRRAAEVTYAVDESTTRWAGAVSKPPGEVSQPKAARPKKIQSGSLKHTR